MSISSTLVKGAICGALLFGNVVPPEKSYIEDDGDFNSVATFLTEGWGWFQLTSAKAGCTINDSSDCDFGGTVIINPGDDDWGDDWWDYPDPGTGFGDDGGDGGGDPAPPADPQCLEPSTSYLSCRATGLRKYRDTIRLCAFIPIDSYFDRCESGADATLVAFLADCEVNESIRRSQCN